MIDLSYEDRARLLDERDALIREFAIDECLDAVGKAIEAITSYDNPQYDDIGMQEVGSGGEWARVKDLRVNILGAIRTLK
jgi:hypothetical protein